MMDEKDEKDACEQIKILPVDGYFWIERNGRIIDNHFKEEQMILDTFGCVYDKYYKEAPEIVQKVYVGMLLKGYNDLLKITTQKEMDEFIDKWKPEWNKQCLNVFVEWKKRGGIIKFGSMGYRKKKSNIIHWEYGNEIYSKAKHYNYKNYIKV